MDMKRLTKVDDQDSLLVSSISNTGATIIEQDDPYRELIERLRAYEDIGLEPEEIEEIKEKTIAQKMFKPNPNMYCCPNCGEALYPMWSNCPWCGQHVTDN